MKLIAILISIPAAILWFGAAFFLSRWTIHWLKGNLVPGDHTSGGALAGIFLACAVATVFGFYATAKAWLGKSNILWQVLSLILAFFTLWAVMGD